MMNPIEAAVRTVIALVGMILLGMYSHTLIMEPAMSAAKFYALYAGMIIALAAVLAALMD